MCDKNNKKNIVKKCVNSFVWYFGLLNNRKSNNYRKNVLIIRTDLIGDYVLFTPALKYLRNEYRDMNISLILQDAVSGIAYDSPYIDDLIVFNKKKYRLNLFYKIYFLWRIKNRNFKIVLNAIYSRDRISDEITLWSCAQEKMGWDTLMPGLYLDEKIRDDKIYTRLLTSTNIKKNSHELIINRELIKLLGIEIDDFRPSLIILEKHLEKAQQLLAGVDIDNNILVGIIPEANNQRRKWDSINYRKLIELICDTFENTAIIVFGSNSSNSLLKRGVFQRHNIIDLRGKTSLRELPAMLSKCQLVIGNETGPIHIANAIGVRAVCILGGGNFNRFVPYPDELKPQNNIIPVFHKMDCYMCGWDCIYECKDARSFPCINNIPVDKVYEIVKHELEIICGNFKNKHNVFNKV